MSITIDPGSIERFPERAGYYVVTDVFVLPAGVANPEDNDPPVPRFIGTLTGSPYEVEVSGQVRSIEGVRHVQVLGRGKKDGNDFGEKLEFAIDPESDEVTIADGVWERGERVQNADDTDYRHRDGDTYTGKNEALDHWAQWMYADGAEPETHESYTPSILYPRVAGASALEIAQMDASDRADYDADIAAAIAALTAAQQDDINANLDLASRWCETGIVFPAGACFCDLYQKVGLNTSETDPGGNPDPSTLPTLRDWLVSSVIPIPVSDETTTQSSITTFQVLFCSNPLTYPLGSSFPLSTNPFYYPEDYEAPDRTGLSDMEMRPTVLGVIFA